MPEFYFTFGQRYRHEPHPKVGQLAHPDGWFTIESAHHEWAVEKMHEICGPHWANVYDESNKPDLQTFPRGELKRFTTEDTNRVL